MECVSVMEQWLSAASSSQLVCVVVAAVVGLLLWVLALLYCFLRLTTVVEPNLGRADSEKVYTDPESNTTREFPSTLDDEPSIYLSLVVPAYNEEERLPVMMAEAMPFLEERAKSDPTFTYEVIIVNDGSRDRTSDVALKYVQYYGVDKVRLLEFVKNRGKGGAVRMGCLSARGGKILFLDADGATEIRDMQRLEKALDGVTSDPNVPAVVVGSRAHLQEEAVAKRSFFRNILMYGFHFVVYVLCVRGIRDTQCGFKMMTRSAAATLFQIMHIDRWAFDVELLYIAQELGMPIKEVPVNWQEIDGSKLVPFWSWLQMGRDILFIRLRYLFGIWTLHTASKVKTN